MSIVNTKSEQPQAVPSLIQCKLPLLDGDADKTAAQLLRVELGDCDKLQKLYHADYNHSESVLCTAWALLLRCYTGQDDIVFHLRSKGSRQPSPSKVQITFEDDSALSSYTQRALEEIASLAQNKSPGGVVPSGADSSFASQDTNTGLWIRDTTPLKTLDNLQDFTPLVR